jgi:hypothetical protein
MHLRDFRYSKSLSPRVCNKLSWFIPYIPRVMQNISSQVSSFPVTHVTANNSSLWLRTTWKITYITAQLHNGLGLCAVWCSFSVDKRFGTWFKVDKRFYEKWKAKSGNEQLNSLGYLVNHGYTTLFPYYLGVQITEMTKDIYCISFNPLKTNGNCIY